MPGRPHRDATLAYFGLGWSCDGDALRCALVGRDDELQRAISLVEEHGWSVAGVARRGYVKVRCGCGVHTGWFHKTPSNPKHYREKANFLIRQCSTQQKESS